MTGTIFGLTGEASHRACAKMDDLSPISCGHAASGGMHLAGLASEGGGEYARHRSPVAATVKLVVPPVNTVALAGCCVIVVAALSESAASLDAVLPFASVTTQR